LSKGDGVEQVSTTQCHVSIYAPNGQDSFAFHANDVGTSLLSVETTKDLHHAVGSFTLTLDARVGEDGRRWDERIPRRALVFIHMDRAGSAPDAGDTTVMIGFTDRHGVQEAYGQAAPLRRCVLSGRELSSVILDAMLWFHPALAGHPEYGTVTIENALLGPVQLALIANPALVEAGLDPKQAVRLILNTYLFAGGETPPALHPGPGEMPVPQRPLITIDLPGMPLARLLDLNADAWSTFQPVIVPLAQFPTGVGSLWNYLHLYVDRHFQEFFTRIEEGQCRIHFRGKPFLHDKMVSGSRFKSTQAEPTLHTIELDPADILSQQLSRDTTQVYNVFAVIPRGFSDEFTMANFRQVILPQVVTEPDEPSFIGRYGLRIMEVRSMYLSPFAPGPPPGTAVPPPQALKPPPGAATTYAPLANQIAAQYGIPDALRPWFVASIEQESYWNPIAVGTSGEKGLGQLMAGTAAQMGVPHDFDPVNSLTGAARYWQYLRSFPYIGDNPLLILAGYNAGPGAVQAAGGRVPASAEQHVRAVTSIYARNQSLAGGTPPPLPSTTAGGTPPPLPSTTAVSGSNMFDALPMIEAAQQWARILRTWYDMGGELLSGTIVVRGQASWNIGHRLFCRHALEGPWEAYIEGVHHTYDVRSGQYLTVLRVTRGWYLSAAWARQMRTEGKTTVQRATGGPPTAAPGRGAQGGAADDQTRFAGTPLLGVRPGREEE
jgi:Transglycosylase SLT domain